MKVRRIKKFAVFWVGVFLLMMMTSLCPAAAEPENAVRVIVENTTFDERNAYWEDGDFWKGTLVDTRVSLEDDSTMLTCIADAIEGEGLTIDYDSGGSFATGYISSINGLGEFDAGEFSGWMGTLNDWFTNEGFGAFSVKNGKLRAGDEIRVMYTCDLGDDIGGRMGGDQTTRLSSLTFQDASGKSVGTLSPAFDPDMIEGGGLIPTNYTLKLKKEDDAVRVVPKGFNKCYQIRWYHFEAEKAPSSPEKIDFSAMGDYRQQLYDLKNGDVIYVMCGHPDWPAMGSGDGGHLYRITVEREVLPVSALRGDADCNGKVDILDTLAIQIHLAKIKPLSEQGAINADVDGKSGVQINDALRLQMFLAKMIGEL